MPSTRCPKRSQSILAQPRWALLGAGALALALAAAACSGEDRTELQPEAGMGGGSQAGSDGQTAGGSGGDTAASGSGGSGGMGGTEPGPPRAAQKVLVLHTNDLHSHLMGYGPERDYTPATRNDDSTRGGMARLATAIGRARAAASTNDKPVLLLDAGDFMMGTLFELLATQEVPELVLMQALGYDATTIGNHELDWTPSGLAAMLAAASAKQVTLPILSSNMQFSSAAGDDALQAVIQTTNIVRPKLVKSVGNLKVGIFGLLGANAAQVTPQASPLSFEAIDVAAARIVTELRNEDGVDVVIALSHSGIDRDGRGEDAALASAVPGIDLIISGHTHDSLSQPVRVGNTLIVTAGSYGSYLGELALTITPPARAGQRANVAVDGYTLLDIDDSIPGDAMTQTGIDQYIAGLDSAVLAPRSLGYRALLARTSVDLPLPAAEEAPIGNLVTDAYRSIVSALEPSAPPALAFDANGQIRAPLLKGATGEIWLTDLFQVLPIGIGPDQLPGFPLVTFYLSASDIRAGLELGAAAELVGNDNFLQISGMKVSYAMSQPAFQRVSSLSLVTGSGEQALNLTDTATCYKVTTTNYVAGLLGVVNSATGGALSVVAKDADCTTPVDPTTRFVDADPLTDGVQELKHWQALLGYVSSLPDTGGADAGDGVPDVPSVYGAAQGRIVKQ
jgi:5'-nucleotidase / UDP-sugar diphosphatase